MGLWLIEDDWRRCLQAAHSDPEGKRIFAHEEWEYETTCSPAVAHLKGLVLSCWHCHAVEHLGATGNMVLSGDLSIPVIEDTIEHFCKVNQVGRGAFEAHRLDAHAEWIQLGKFEWTVDWGTFGSLITGQSLAGETFDDGRIDPTPGIQDI